MNTIKANAKDEIDYAQADEAKKQKIAETEYAYNTQQEQRAYDEYKARRELLEKEGDINSTDPYIKNKAIVS